MNESNKSYKNQPLILLILMLLSTLGDFFREFAFPYADGPFGFIEDICLISMIFGLVLAVVVTGVALCIFFFLLYKKRLKDAALLFVANLVLWLVFGKAEMKIYRGINTKQIIYYCPKSTEEASSLGILVCKYQQSETVLLLDSIEIKVDDAFACYKSYYDESNELQINKGGDVYFVADLRNNKKLKTLEGKYYIEGVGKEMSPFYRISDFYKTSVTVDSITGLPPEEIILRIRQDIKDTSGHCKEIYVDSICFVRMQEED